MAYTKTQWNTGDPITQERMNHIEDGISDAHSMASTNNSNVSNLETIVGTLNSDVSGAKQDIQALQRDVSTIGQNSALGAKAWTQVSGAITMNGDTVTKSLNMRFSEAETKIQSAQTEISSARKGKTALIDKIDEMDSDRSSLWGSIGSINTTFNEASNSAEYGINHGSVRARLEYDENKLHDMEDEIKNAHSSDAFNRKYKSSVLDDSFLTLDARFEEGESRIVALETVSGNLDSNKVNYNDIVANLTTNDNNKPLAASQGRELKLTIGGNYNSTNTVATGIANAEQNAKDYTDSILGSNFDTTNTVSKAITDLGTAIQNSSDSLDSAYKAADSALDTRITALETEVDMTSVSSRIDNLASELEAARLSDVKGTTDNDELSPRAYNSLDERLEDIEGDINTIANELGMVDTDDLKTIGTRVDALDAHITTLATELGMISNDEIVDTNTRVDNIEYALNHESTGLAATKAIADQALSKANAAATATDLTNLTTRVTTLEGKDTVIVSGATFSNGIPQIQDPSTNCDYLIKNSDDNKYYYWRYFGSETGWQLISGAGGGSGSSSGEFAASLEAITNPDENTDYFVGNNTIGYTHYRYIPSEIEGGNGTFVRILPKGMLINAGVTETGNIEAYTVEDGTTNVFDGFYAFNDVEATPVKENDQVVATQLTFTDTLGQTHTAIVQGGGGSGSVSSYTVRLNNTLSSLKLTVPKKDNYNAYVKAKVVVKDGGTIVDPQEFDASHTINIAVQYGTSRNGPWTNFTELTTTSNTEFSVDVTSILTLGQSTYVRVQASVVIDEEEKTSSLIYEVNQVEMSISAEGFNPAAVRTTNFNFQYRCMGSGLTKQVHFLIDGVDIAGSPITTTLHNDIAQQTIPLTGLTIGMHSFQVYFTVDGIESNILNYYIIYNNDNTRIAPIIAIAAESSTITYGDDLIIDYTVTTPGQEKTDKVELTLYALDNSTEVEYASDILTGADGTGVINEQLAKWRPTDYPSQGTAYVRATATHTVNGVDYTDTKTIEITINALVLPEGYSLDPAGTENLVYSYEAYGRTNDQAGKETYHYNYTALGNNTIEWTGAFNGFNWSGDGYVDGQSLTISGGATHTVNVPIFQNTYNNISLEDSEGITNITRRGRTVEIEYEVQSATDLNDVIIDFMSNITTNTENGITQKGGVGLQVTPQSCYLLKSGSTINMDETGFILNESDIPAAYLTPGMRIHLAFVIEPWASELAYDNSYHQSVNIYVNGEFANACPYVQGTDDFASSATLRIGSSSCIIKLYQIKMYNRGLTHREILQNYKVAPAATRDKLTRLRDNDILNANGKVDYEKARTKYTCLLLTGPAPIEQDGVVINPTVSPYKGYPSPAGRKDKKTGEAVGKTESGVTLTKANPNKTEGYDIEFDLRDTVPTDQSIEIPTYIGARGAYVSSNNVQGTSSQKYPVHNLKVYLAKWQGPKTTTKEVAIEEGEDTTGLEIVEHDGVQYKVITETSPAEIKKVKYSLKGKDELGEDIGVAESTLCWKADYMSTDHANTYNANIADGLFTDVLPGASWGSKHQNTVYGIRCLLFQKQGDAAPEFLGDGCLNNDKGNNKTYDLERSGDDDPGPNTASQKWEFTNNSDDLGYFKTDTLFKPIGEEGNTHIQAVDAFESTYPDQGDLEDAGLEPNYNHLQIVLTWLSKRANYWDASTTTGTGGTYNGTSYSTERELKKAIFKREFTDHFNMNHALTYYIFSEYIALCDNRVKNMFLRSDNVRSEKIYKVSDGSVIFEGNNNPNADFFKNVNFDRNDIDWENSTFAVWAPVLYDLDSCFGVENVGYIRVRYDANWDYTWNGAPQFNGYESRLWLQFADSFDTEIRATAPSLYNRSDGLNYSNFYRQQIVDNLNNISPALSNQDMLIKFDKPWSEGFMNYGNVPPSYETPYYKYLQRGSRTAQKTAFINMRSKLLASKYGAQEFTNDAIKFRTGVPVGASGNIIGYEDDDPAKPIYGDGDLTQTKITVTANQAMYPGVAYGDNKPATRTLTNNGKVNAGESCDIYATSAVQGNDGIFICGASTLTDIGDISVFRPYQIDVGAGINLKRLIVGSNAAGYTNSNTDTFSNLYKCVLLEEMNIRNCTNVATLDLSNNPLIKKVYAAGSGATAIIFPNGGVLNTVEYSAVTGNITILNQKGLTNFIYENSENNNYGALTKLWVENTPNVPVVDIINKHMSGLTSGIRLTGLDINLYSGASTQAELEEALETTTLFLNTITSELASGKYLDNAGAFNPGSTQPPYISGKIYISEIRASLLAKVNEMYPNLIVYNTINSQGQPSNNVITEYTITYQNYDGTVLYTDHRTGSEHYIDPAFDTNPITGNPYIPIPTKPEDAQYKYRFGTYTEGVYDKYSGWKKSDSNETPTEEDFVRGTTIFVANYPTTELQRYNVRWYAEDGGAAIREYTNVAYGTDISQYVQPEEYNNFVFTKMEGNQIKVFKGWDRPVGRLTGDLNVYAQWEVSTIDNGTQSIDMTTLNAADVYALSQLGSQAKIDLLESKLGTEPIYIKMGQDFDYTSGVTTIDLLNGSNKLTFNNSASYVRIYDGEHGVGTVKPLAANDDWTLALDYKFLLTSTLYSRYRELVLASCYKEADSTIQGFKLSLIKNTDTGSTAQYVRLTWGTNSVNLDYVAIDPTSGIDAKLYSKSYRNMLVLRHRASEPEKLYIYYAAPNISNANASTFDYGSNYGLSINSTVLTWANVGNLDVPLILGGNYSGATTTIENATPNRGPAKGIIYWAKFWDKDLGEKNCEAMAAWPHETVPFYLSGYNNNSDPSRQIIEGTRLTFVAAQGLGDRYIFAKNGNVNSDSLVLEASWGVSDLRALCSERIYNGLPMAYRSIIYNTRVISAGIKNLTNTEYDAIETYDYLYAPTEREVTTTTPANSIKYNEVSTDWPSPWPWMKASNINLYVLED